MKEKTLHRGKNQKSESVKYTLILYNDEINTFDYVIKSLVEICGHDSVQAEQCALIVHLKGSCEIKIGTKEELQPMSLSLNAKGLNSMVESH
jgi:ATP-dependent Clp protease adaptor protein ClpS